MDDLISRQATYLALVEKGQASKRYKLGETWELNGKEIREVLGALPSIQPEPKTGHWVYRPEWSKYGDVWSCSECGEKTSQSVMGEPRFKYCPMCRADMRGEQE